MIFQDIFFLKSFILGYGKKENANASVGDLLSTSVGVVREDIKDQTSRALFAKNVLDSKKVKEKTQGNVQHYFNPLIFFSLNIQIRITNLK